MNYILAIALLCDSTCTLHRLAIFVTRSLNNFICFTCIALSIRVFADRLNRFSLFCDQIWVLVAIAGTEHIEVPNASPVGEYWMSPKCGIVRLDSLLNTTG